MKEFKASIQIRESPDAIWPYLVDPILVTHWVPGLISTQVVEGDITEAGSVLRSAYRINGKEFDSETLIVEVRSPRVVVTQETMKGATMVQRVELTEQGDGVTLVELNLGPIELSASRRLAIALMPTLLRSQGKTALERLKAAVEDPNRKLERADKIPMRPQVPLYVASAVFGVVGWYILTRVL